MYHVTGESFTFWDDGTCIKYYGGDQYVVKSFGVSGLGVFQLERLHCDYPLLAALPSLFPRLQWEIVTNSHSVQTRQKQVYKIIVIVRSM